MGRFAAAAACVVLAWLASASARAQFKVEDPAALAMKIAELMPDPATRAAQDAQKRYTPPTPEEMRARGKADAPALATAAGIDCRIADARWIGDGPERPHRPQSIFYEVACADDLGFVLVRTQGAPVQAIPCLETETSHQAGRRDDLRCTLTANLDQRIGLVPYIARTGKACAPERVRGLGHSDTSTAFELACRDGEGFVMMTSTPPRLDRPIEIHPCLSYPPAGRVSCLYTDRQAQLAVVDRLAARAGIDCAPTQRTYIGESDRDGASFWEVACAGGHGYLLEQGLDGGLAKAVDCASADTVLTGGCHLTDSRQARLQWASSYAQQVRGAGFDCLVNAYAAKAPRADGATAVELACADRPDGAVAFLPASGPISTVDCAHADLLGYRCGLTPAAAAYPRLTADLRALGRTTCIVSGARAAGVTAERHGFEEVACADGLQGFMIEYRLDPITPLSATVCGEARAVGAGCILPRGNRG